MIPSTANSAYQAQQPKDGRRYVARPQYEQPHLPPTRPTASESVQTLAVPVADTQAVNVQTQPAIASTQDDDQFQQLVELEGELFPVPAVRGVEDKSQVQQSETITIGTSATGTSLARSIWDEMQEHCKSCKGGYKDHEYRISGKRCSEVIPFYYDYKDKIFHREFKEWRVPCSMIQNSKKSCYLLNDGALNEFFFDSYEGWYIQSKHHGHRVNMTSESAARFRQCDVGVELNTMCVEAAKRVAHANQK